MCVHMQHENGHEEDKDDEDEEKDAHTTQLFEISSDFFYYKIIYKYTQLFPFLLFRLRDADDGVLLTLCRRFLYCCCS